MSDIPLNIKMTSVEVTGKSKTLRTKWTVLEKETPDEPWEIVERELQRKENVRSRIIDYGDLLIY